MPKPPHSQRGQQPSAQQQPPQPQRQPQRIEVHNSWTGPLPRPEDLAKFNQIIPNGAERIVAMAEREQQHRIAREAEGQNAQIREARRGQYLGAVVVIMAIGGAIYNASVGGHWGTSVALLGLTTLAIVRAIIRPR